MPSSPVDEIKSRLDIIEVIGSYIKLVKAGRNWRARCPFHNERTPSFMVSPERQIWHCFGCNLGGDIFAFVKQVEGVEFGDALRILAKRAGVVLKRQDPAVQTQRKRLYEICELAAKFFEKQLDAGKNGQEAKKYLLQKRGLKPETVRQWRIGWAPDGWHSLSDFLLQRGYARQEIIDSGLAISGDAQNQTSNVKYQKFYDRFRSRIMFPLFDIQGQVVGFAGRIFGKEDPNVGKYINTPQTILYDKSRLLFGLNFAKMEIRQKNACVFVEGNLDVIMSHQAGVTNTVACSGTALTPQHLLIIKRYTDNLIFSFDTDEAGQTATKRSIDLALENDFDVNIIDISAKDPADLIKDDPAAWRRVMEKPISVLDFYFSTSFSKFDPASPEGKKQLGKTLLPVIKRISNQIEQAHWMAELSRHLKIDEKILYSEMRKIKPETVSFQNSYNNIEDKKKTVDRSRITELEERLFSLFLDFPEHLKIMPEPREVFFDERFLAIAKDLKEIAKEHPEKEKFLDALSKRLPDELAATINRLTFKNSQYILDESSALAEINECLKALRIEKIKDKMQKLGFDIQEAQTKNDKKSLERFKNDFKELSCELTELTK